MIIKLVEQNEIMLKFNTFPSFDEVLIFIANYKQRTLNCISINSALGHAGKSLICGWILSNLKYR